MVHTLTQAFAWAARRSAGPIALALVVSAAGTPAQQVLAMGPDQSLTCAAPAPADCANPTDAGGAAAANLQVSVPDGGPACPASGPGASCVRGALPTPRVGAGSVSLSSDAPGQVATGTGVTLVARTWTDVAGIGAPVEVVDQTSGGWLTWCSAGIACATTVTAKAPGAHTFVAYVSVHQGDGSVGVIQASAPVTVTWFSVKLAVDNPSPSPHIAFHLTATADTDLGAGPWVLSIYDQDGNLLQSCAGGSSCTVASGRQGTSTFVAYVGDYATHAPPARVVARSNVVTVTTGPAWGVDSCQRVVGEPADNYGVVTSTLGVPGFWGRYLSTTGQCHGLTRAEITAAASWHMGLLPIYDDYDCSDVSGYGLGADYASHAVALARKAGEPAGKVIAVDIEPPGPDCPYADGVDAGFIEGWYTIVSQAGYTPLFYGDASGDSAFTQAFCGAVSAFPQVATGSYVWSFEPSLLGSQAKAAAPAWAPHNGGCGERVAAWQYRLAIDDTPVDSDLALPSLPLWYP